MLQRRVLYLPPSEPLRAADVHAAGLEFWPGQASFRGLLAQPDGPARATVLVFHGNASSALARSYYAAALGRLGLRVILAEYPGYAGRPGTPTEAALIADGVATLARISEDFAEPVIVWGESLGAAVAAGVVAQATVPVQAAVLVTPWASLARMVARTLPVVPAALVRRDRYDSTAYLAAFDGPIAVVIAGRDEVIPPDEGRRLYDALATRKRLWWFDEASHNSWPAHPAAPWWNEVVSFVLEAPPARPAGSGTATDAP
ncbi:MAG: alpha/beta fold hydrolase [Gammaproteobacteria bacterium]|nr:alpha/beta fold hydrolase [Gammaproteobacteria bacterium]